MPPSSQLTCAATSQEELVAMYKSHEIWSLSQDDRQLLSHCSLQTLQLGRVV